MILKEDIQGVLGALTLAAMLNLCCHKKKQKNMTYKVGGHVELCLRVKGKLFMMV